MDFKSEQITKFNYIEIVQKIATQSYLIKKVLHRNITMDLLDSIRPDYDIIYFVDFDIDKNEFTSFNFQFKGNAEGFILKNGKIAYRVNSELSMLEMADEADISEFEHKTITEWYASKIGKINYVNFGNIFYLSDSC